MRVNPFYSSEEHKLPDKDQRYHNNNLCNLGQGIIHKRYGTIGRLCDRCRELNARKTGN